MKVSKLPLSAVIPGMGFLAYLLRSGLYVFGTDEKGLLIPGHPLALALWLLTAALSVLVLLSLGKQKGTACAAGGITAAAGCFVFAATIVATSLVNRYAYTVPEHIRNIAGLLAVPALVWVGICRLLRRQPPFFCHGLVCLALTLHTVSRYSGWSSCPQLQNAFFPMMGCLLLMLFAYYQTALDANMGNCRMQLGSGLLAAYACFAAIPGSDTALLYLAGGIWTLTNLGALTPPASEEKENVQ